jgi:hypothetical protein
LTETVLEVAKQQHTRDLTGIIAKEEATYRGDSPENNGLDAAVGAIDADGPVGWVRGSPLSKRGVVYLLLSKHPENISANINSNDLFI